MNKYKLDKNDFISFRGLKLYRIIALKDFGNVDSGQKGGFIESEDNLNEDGDAWVYGDAQVHGKQKFKRNPIQIIGSFHNLNYCGEGIIRIGCIYKKYAEWVKKFRCIGKENNHTDSQIREYGAYIKLIGQIYNLDKRFK